MIVQALEYGAKFNREELHLGELGIATLSALFINANRDPKKGEPSKPNDFFYFQAADQKVRIDGLAAETFFALAKDEKLEQWMVGIAPMQELLAARNYGSLRTRDRALIGQDALIINPTYKDGKVFSALAIFQRGGELWANDADTGDRVCVVVPPGASRWCTDESFELQSFDEV